VTGHIERLAPYRTASALGAGRRLVKRAIDLVLGCLLVLLLLPVLAAVALAVRWTTPGPVLFRQERVGYLGQPFTMLKFRSMRSDGEDGSHREYVRRLLRDDLPPADGFFGGFKPDLSHRVTRVGRLLRRTSLDELPQLFNVLRGEMSLVGPRPAIPYEVEMFDARQRRRTAVPPGMTGLWQVCGRSRMTMREAIELDLEYVDRQTTRLDLVILVRTLPAVLLRVGAE
jgi:lipopolysaccharide/colanic/teichoic acid biosynthesis glycosyltransferase